MFGWCFVGQLVEWYPNDVLSRVGYAQQLWPSYFAARSGEWTLSMFVVFLSELPSCSHDWLVNAGAIFLGWPFKIPVPYPVSLGLVLDICKSIFTTSYLTCDGTLWYTLLLQPNNSTTFKLCQILSLCCTYTRDTNRRGWSANDIEELSKNSSLCV